MDIVEKQAIRLTGFKVEAKFEDLFTKVPEAWKELFERAEEIPHKKSNVMTEISMKVENGVYTEIVGAEVRENGKIPDGMINVLIPKQTYIHYRHKGTLEEIADSFGKMYEWAREHGYETGDFKIDQGYSSDGADQDHELFIKVEK